MFLIIQDSWWKIHAYQVVLGELSLFTYIKDMMLGIVHFTFFIGWWNIHIATCWIEFAEAYPQIERIAVHLLNDLLLWNQDSLSWSPISKAAQRQGTVWQVPKQFLEGRQIDTLAATRSRDFNWVFGVHIGNNKSGSVKASQHLHFGMPSRRDPVPWTWHFALSGHEGWSNWSRLKHGGWPPLSDG